MTASSPLVSVCMPSYNSAPFVSAAIRSVLAQDMADWELIIVDDCSTDGTAEIAGRFKDPRIRFSRNDSKAGPQENWNRCVRLARGRYVKLLCSDDVLHPACLRLQAEALDKHGPEGVGLVTCARDIIDEAGRRLMSRRFPGPQGVHDGRQVVRRSIRHGTNIIGEPSAVMFTVEAWARAGGFDGRIAYIIDLDMWFRLLRSHDLYVQKQTLCGFRVSSGSWTSSLGRKQSRQFRAFIRKMRGTRWAEIGTLDALSGHARAVLNGLARRMVYRLSRPRDMDRHNGV